MVTSIDAVDWQSFLVSLLVFGSFFTELTADSYQLTAIGASAG
jgi:hypothetical protein